MNILITSILFFFMNIAHGQAIIKFDSIKYTLKPVKLGLPSKVRVHFMNIGNEPLIIRQVQTNVPSADWPREPISPNKDGYIDIGIPASAIGKSRHIILVSTNANEPNHEILINLKVVGANGETNVSGFVRDSSRQAIPGTSIRILNSHIGTSASLTGHYSLLAKPTDTLCFSAVAFFEQKVSASSEELDVVLIQRPNKEVDFGPPPTPIRRIKTEPFQLVTVKDLKNVNNPKCNFKKLSKKNSFILYLSNTFKLNETDSLFQIKYNVHYSWGFGLEYTKKFNLLTIKHLNKVYKKDWQMTVRKDVVGLKILKQ